VAPPPSGEQTMAVIGSLADVLRRNAQDEQLRRGLEYLGTLGRNFLAAEGLAHSARVELAGEDLVALHQVYRTRDPAETRYEAHRRYVDLQFVHSGEERIRLAALASGRATTPYDPEKDVEFFAAGPGMDLLLRAGMVAIFYPEDLHAPGLWLATPTRVAKTVIKVRI